MITAAFAPLLAAGVAGGTFPNETVVTVGMIVGFAAVIKWCTDVWSNLRPKKSLEDRFLKLLAQIEDKREIALRECKATCASNLMQTESRLNKALAQTEAQISTIQTERKESAAKLHDKIDRFSQDVRGEMASVRETLGKQFGELVGATQRVTNDYSLLIGELRGEMKARRDRESKGLPR